MKEKKGAEAALYEYYNIANKNVAELCNHQKALTPPPTPNPPPTSPPARTLARTLNLGRTLNLTSTPTATPNPNQAASPAHDAAMEKMREKVATMEVRARIA